MMKTFLLAVIALAAGLWSFVGEAEPRLIDDKAAVSSVLDLIAERLATMPEVAAAKWISGAPVVDPERETAVLDRSTARAETLGLDPRPVRELLAQQIALARDLQLRLHAEWRASACAPCASPPDLAVLRARIDRINEGLLRALYLAVPALQRSNAASAWRPNVEARLAEVMPSAADRDELVRRLGRIRFASAPGLDRVRASGVLRIGTTGDYAPFSVESGGRARGADIALGEALAAALGVEPVFMRTTWSTLVEDLKADRYDLAMGGISVTPERAASGRFSVPYLAGGKTILARCSDRQRFASLAAVDHAGVQVIVNPGGTNERYVREHLRFATILVHPDNRTVFDELLAGRADVMFTDDVEADLQARRHPQLCRTFSGTLTHSEKAVFLSGDSRLGQAVDDWLRGAIARGDPARLLKEAMTQ